MYADLLKIIGDLLVIPAYIHYHVHVQGTYNTNKRTYWLIGVRTFFTSFSFNTSVKYDRQPFSKHCNENGSISDTTRVCKNRSIWTRAHLVF